MKILSCFLVALTLTQNAFGGGWIPTTCGWYYPFAIPGYNYVPVRNKPPVGGSYYTVVPVVLAPVGAGPYYSYGPAPINASTVTKPHYNYGPPLAPVSQTSTNASVIVGIDFVVSRFDVAVQITALGTPGVRYVLQSSTNLVDWRGLSDLFIDTSGVGSVTVPDPFGGKTRQFFRVSKP